MSTYLAGGRLAGGSAEVDVLYISHEPSTLESIEPAHSARGLKFISEWSHALDEGNGFLAMGVSNTNTHMLNTRNFFFSLLVAAFYTTLDPSLPGGVDPWRGSSCPLIWERVVGSAIAL